MVGAPKGGLGLESPNIIPVSYWWGRAITNREIQEALKHGDKHVQENGRIQHRHPMYSAGGHQAHRLVVITEADGTLVVTQFDRDNDL